MMTHRLNQEGSPERADLSACRVLVVDDAHSIRRVIGAFLATAGIQQVEYAMDGVEGLAKVESFKPDLVILDIIMPEMDGFEVCRRMRADPRHEHLPILVQTALESPSERTAVFRAGATDLITKPLHGPELIARVRVQLENRLLIRDLEDYRRSMRSELDSARRMQESLLPAAATMAKIAAGAGLRLESHFQPSAELGGDMWTVCDLGDGKVGIATVDFAGHGVTAALNTFRLHTLMHQMPPPDPEQPAAYLADINVQLADLLPVQQFATMFYGILDTRRGLLTYAAAGAPGPVLGDPSGEIRVLESSGIPLGITRKATYANRRAEFPEGSFLLLYSDALTETPEIGGAREMENHDLVEMVRLSRADHDVQSPLSALLSRFMKNRQPLIDDLTVVWLSSGNVAG